MSTVKPPKLSVIIADVNGPPMIGACLEALSRQHGDVDAEVIVAEATGEETVRFIHDQFPWVEVLPFPNRTTIPELRVAALKHSSGDIVAVIEDHCDPDEHWCEEIINAHQAHPECIAVGGAVENGNCQRLMISSHQCSSGSKCCRSLIARQFQSCASPHYSTAAATLSLL